MSNVNKVSKIGSLSLDLIKEWQIYHTVVKIYYKYMTLLSAGDCSGLDNYVQVMDRSLALEALIIELWEQNVTIETWEKEELMEGALLYDFENDSVLTGDTFDLLNKIKVKV